MSQRSLGSGKGHQGPRMGTGTSREMFLEHCMGALHGSIAADVLDPSAVCGGPHEVCYWIRDQSVMVDHAGIPGLLGGGEWALQKNAEKRKLQINDGINAGA